jgi:hypothetical protein
MTTFSGKKCLSGKVICAFFSRLSKFSCTLIGTALVQWSYTQTDRGIHSSFHWTVNVTCVYKKFLSTVELLDKRDKIIIPNNHPLIVGNVKREASRL